jgi:hypothetical protein
MFGVKQALLKMTKLSLLLLELAPTGPQTAAF